MSLLSGGQTVCAEQAALPHTPPPDAACSRRLPGRCYLCGDPAVGEWFCAAHLGVGEQVTNALGHVTREHAYWIERFTPGQILELAACLER